jgi:hypothetical protein
LATSNRSSGERSTLNFFALRTKQMPVSPPHPLLSKAVVDSRASLVAWIHDCYELADGFSRLDVRPADDAVKRHYRECSSFDDRDDSIHVPAPCLPGVRWTADNLTAESDEVLRKYIRQLGSASRRT